MRTAGIRWLALAFIALALLPLHASAQQATALPAANLPLSGAEVMYLVQNGNSVQTPVSTIQGVGTFNNLSATNLTVTGASNLATVNLSGKLSLPASTTGSAYLNLAQGAAPSSPVNGDLWTTSSGLFARIAGSTVGPFGTGGGSNSASANDLAYYAATGNVVSGLATANSGVLVTSPFGVPSISTVLPTGLTIGPFVGTIVNYATSASLPTVTSSNAGQLGFVTNCLNGSQGSGTGTGCLYIVNNAGSWQPMPLIPTTQITIGGQAIYLGGATTNQGTGSKVATANGTFTNGDCLQTNSTGAIVDAGAACGSGGTGSGTVTSSTANYLAYYASTGTTVAGLASANNAVLVTNGSGAPSESTTLPSSLTIPTATLSNPVITGTGTYAALTGSAKLTTAASTTTQAGLNIPAGTAPTSPSNGDVWTTTGGLFARINGSTQGPFGTSSGTVSSIATTSPIGGGTITTTGTITCTTCALTTNGGLLTATSPTAISAAGVISCATCVTSSGGGAATATAPVAVSSAGLITCITCATTTNGGALTATSPMTISAAGVIALASQTGAAAFNWDSNTTVTANTYYIAGSWPWGTGSITSVSYLTGGTSSPGFNIAVQINGTNVATCNGITVNSGTIATTTCGSNSITSGQKVTLVLSAVTGSPYSSLVQVNYTRSAI
jgi:hypothetical protein